MLRNVSISVFCIRSHRAQYASDAGSMGLYSGNNRTSHIRSYYAECADSNVHRNVRKSDLRIRSLYASDAGSKRICNGRKSKFRNRSPAAHYAVYAGSNVHRNVRKSDLRIRSLL